MPETFLTIGVTFITLLVVLAVYNRIEGVRLVRDAITEWRLRRLPLAKAVAQFKANPRVADVVVCLTTIPSRVDRLDLTLKSLLVQRVRPKAIRLHLPRHSRREGCPYPVPAWLAAIDCVQVVRCDDLGPATKLLPALAELPSAQRILVVDDDRVYHSHLVGAVADYAAVHPEHAFGFSGWVVPADHTDRPTTLWADLRSLPPVPIKCSRTTVPVPIDIVQGYAGYSVTPGFFDLEEVTDYSGAPEAAFFVDDVWLSAHCRAPKYVIPAPPSNFLSYLDGMHFKRSSLGLINRGEGGPDRRHNTIVIRHFIGRWLTDRPDRSK